MIERELREKAGQYDKARNNKTNYINRVSLF
jgi:hypothetical protein